MIEATVMAVFAPCAQRSATLRIETCNRSVPTRRRGAVTGSHREDSAATGVPDCASVRSGVYHLPPQEVQIERRHVRVARGWNDVRHHCPLRCVNHRPSYPGTCGGATRDVHPRARGSGPPFPGPYESGIPSGPDSPVAPDRHSPSGVLIGKVATLKS